MRPVGNRATGRILQEVKMRLMNDLWRRLTGRETYAQVIARRLGI